MYKWANEENTAVKALLQNPNSQCCFISFPSGEWDKYIEWVNEGNETLPFKNVNELKLESYNFIIAKLNELKDTKSTYIHYMSDNNSYKFFLDIKSIESTRNRCIGLNNDDPIPTPGDYYGSWESENVVDNKKVKVNFTVAEFIEFYNMCYTYKADLWLNYKKHLEKLDLMLNDSNYSVTDIKKYNYKENW